MRTYTVVLLGGPPKSKKMKELRQKIEQYRVDGGIFIDRYSFKESELGEILEAAIWSWSEQTELPGSFVDKLLKTEQ